MTFLGPHAAPTLCRRRSRPRAGKRLVIGNLVLESDPGNPALHLMDEAQLGLRAALKPEWRGGVSCRVVEAAPSAFGDRVELA